MQVQFAFCCFSRQMVNFQTHLWSLSVKFWSHELQQQSTSHRQRPNPNLESMSDLNFGRWLIYMKGIVVWVAANDYLCLIRLMWSSSWKRRVSICLACLMLDGYKQFNEEAKSPFVKKHKTIIHPGEVCLGLPVGNSGFQWRLIKSGFEGRIGAKYKWLSRSQNTVGRRIYAHVGLKQ
jgi:hypothetical protein